MPLTAQRLWNGWCFSLALCRSSGNRGRWAEGPNCRAEDTEDTTLYFSNQTSVNCHMTLGITILSFKGHYQDLSRMSWPRTESISARHSEQKKHEKHRKAIKSMTKQMALYPCEPAANCYRLCSLCNRSVWSFLKAKKNCAGNASLCTWEACGVDSWNSEEQFSSLEKADTNVFSWFSHLDYQRNTENEMVCSSSVSQRGE